MIVNKLRIAIGSLKNIFMRATGSPAQAAATPRQLILNGSFNRPSPKCWSVIKTEAEILLQHMFDFEMVK